MNIDKKKFQEHSRAVDGSRVMRSLEYAEIPPDNCSDCGHLNSLEERPCIGCSIGKINHFKPGVNELDKLFIGAPVMLVRDNSKERDLITYKGHDCTAVRCHFELPTVKESPYNVWLAPPINMPLNDLKDVNNVLYRTTDLSVLNKQEYIEYDAEWEDVKAFMIMGDFK